jgi:hypothetical protein
MIGLRWRKSSYTDANGNCVELAHTRDLVRDSKNPEPVLNVRVDVLLAAIKADRIG